MSEVKDSAIKLFGKTIPLPEASAPPVGPQSLPLLPDPAPCENLNRDRSLSPASSDSDGAGQTHDCDEAMSCKRLGDVKQYDGNHTSMETTDPNESSSVENNPKATTADNESPASKTAKDEADQNETSNSQDKTPKKPDKILPCPRCNSMDTKFCYYNNYNVNQPRHFCKNCQRYWTAGGTMRNVPVGAGRRKNKNSASHYRHITVPEAFHNSRIDLPNGTHYPALRPNGTVLTFGSDTPLCESMASVLITDKTIQNCARNGFHKPEDLRIPNPYKDGETGDDHSNGSSVTAANPKDDNGSNGSKDIMMQNCQSFPPQVPVFPGPMWPYPAQWAAPPGFCPPGFPMPFYPAPPYWGCTVQAPPWPVPWVTSPPALGTGPNSPTLGKHSRDENTIRQTEEEEKQNEHSSERSLWIPKTLRIDDPGEAAKSSIWATLGIKQENCDSSSNGGGGLFTGFQSKADEKKSGNSKTSPVLQANPAALSRSQNFQESS